MWVWFWLWFDGEDANVAVEDGSRCGNGCGWKARRAGLPSGAAKGRRKKMGGRGRSVVSVCGCEGEVEVWEAWEDDDGVTDGASGCCAAFVS